MVQVVYIDNKTIGIKIAGHTVIGVYRQGREGIPDIEDWLLTCEQIGTTGPVIALGDWNAHHPHWSLDGRLDGRGRVLKEGMEGLGLQLDPQFTGPTFRRSNSQQSRIDLVFRNEEASWATDSITMEWLLGDHCAFAGTIDTTACEISSPPIRSTIDIAKLGDFLSTISKQTEQEQGFWDASLEGSTA